MSATVQNLKKSATRELVIFLCLLILGILILPLAIYLVGNFVFGTYGGTGILAFYGTLLSAIFAVEPVVLFLVLSPYLIWQLARLTLWGFRRTPSPHL